MSDSGIIELSGQLQTEPSRLFSNYAQWINLRKTIRPEINESIDGLTRSNIAGSLFSLADGMRRAANPQTVKLLQLWSKKIIQDLLTKMVTQGLLKPSSDQNAINSKTTGLFHTFPQDGLKCIAQVITGCLEPYGINKSYDSLFNDHSRFSQQRGFKNSLYSYQAILADNQLESKLVDNPPDLIGYALCGYPIVGINPDKWHAYALVGHDISLGIRSNLSVAPKIDLSFRSTSPYQPASYDIDLIPQHFKSYSWLVLNPILKK